MISEEQAAELRQRLEATRALLRETRAFVQRAYVKRAERAQLVAKIDSELKR